MRSLLPSLAIVVAVSMTPGALELVENAGHLLGHGDAAHADHTADASDADDADDADRHDDNNGNDDEHGCTGAYHACACHASPHFAQTSSVIRLVSKVSSGHSTFFAAAVFDDSGFIDGVDRPPQA